MPALAGCGFPLLAVGVLAPALVVDFLARMVGVFRFLSLFPLWLLHAMGSVCGWLVYLLAASYRRRWRYNRDQAGLSASAVRAAIADNGRMMFELPRLWFGQPVPCVWQGLEHAEQAYAAGKGVVFLTPHIGCFEITAQAMAERMHQRYGDLTVLYRPARQPWLAAMMQTARRRAGLNTVPTTLAGVRQMMKALRQGKAVGLLPDHVPPEGQGLWSPFFGKPAYTMTLAAKLAHQTGATLMVVWGERLPRGRGFVLHCLAPIADLPDDLQAAVDSINQHMERLILQYPGQYMWSYARYRQPRPQPAPLPVPDSSQP